MADEAMKPSVTADIITSEGYYVASCREIFAVTQGASFEEMVANLQEVVQLFLEGENPADYGLVPNPSIVLVYECEPVNA